MFEIYNSATRCVDAFLNGKINTLITVYKEQKKKNILGSYEQLLVLILLTHAKITSVRFEYAGMALAIVENAYE